MQRSGLEEHFDLKGRPALDRLLRFEAPIAARYDAEHSAERLADLRSAILVGLVFYNLYNITSFALLPDTIGLSLILRLGMVTPLALALVWAIGRISPLWTERFVAAAVFGTYVVPVFLFWNSHSPLGLFTFGELSLTIIFANMLLTLRFFYAILFTSGALAVTLLAIASKSDLGTPLAFAFTVQVLTACAFALYANYREERRRSLDYLATLSARLEASGAHEATRTYRYLSLTDALTQLPNRRSLTDQLEKAFGQRRPLAALMIDIDHFKSYNDTLGHPAGDDCLRRVADCFARIAANTDGAFCARFGGEEFTFLLQDRGELVAARLARLILRDVTNLAIVHPARSDGLGIVTVSIGVARASWGATGSPQDLLHAADAALYIAKRRGRNQFSLWDSQAEQPAVVI